jgi:PIN domain nuclease of toxin-antitoxin system
MILLDTHVLVWWLSSPKLLSTKARKLVDSGVADSSLKVSAITAWEIAMLVAQRRLRLGVPPNEWIPRAAALPFLEFVPVDVRIALRTAELPGELHADPADRMIAATALERGWTLVTKDERLQSCRFLRTVW